MGRRAARAGFAPLLALLLPAVLVLAGCSANAGPRETPGTSADASPPTARSSPPVTVEDLPPGDPPLVPTWRRGVLHVGGTSIRTPLRQIAFAGGTTVVGRIQPGPRAGWWLVDGDRLVEIVRAADIGVPVISPDGRLVVWSEVGPEVTTVRAWDVPGRRLVASHEVEIRPMCCTGPSLEVHGVDGGHRVYLRALRAHGSPLTMWVPATGKVVPVTGLGALGPSPSTITARGPVFQARTQAAWGHPAGVHGSVGEDGRFRRAGRVPSDQAGVWSPDGRLFAHPGDERGEISSHSASTAVNVRDVDEGRRRLMDLPRGGIWSVWWESGDSLVVRLSGASDGHELVRCDVQTGSCERALSLGRTNGWWFPF